MRLQLRRYLLVIVLSLIWSLCIREIITNLREIKYLPEIPGMKRIHFWNRPGWFSRNAFLGCNQTCKMTEGKYIPENSDAVVFHSPDIWLDRPPQKPQGQIWVFYGMEPPMHHRLSFYNWNNVFNWTMTYRRDADIFFPYGIFHQKKVRHRNQSNTFNPWKKKTAAWFVSNCNTQSKREEFVKLLKMYMDIEVYGYCGSYSCKQNENRKCLDRLDKEYNYYLSFENSLCRDYVTEKFFKIYYLSNVIPVVRGNTNYAMYGPPDSYIDASKFSSARTLSRHLASVATTENLFSTFFKSRDSYYITEATPESYCELCRRLHYASSYKRLYDDIGHWVHGSDHVPICITPNGLKMLSIANVPKH